MHPTHHENDKQQHQIFCRANASRRVRRERRRRAGVLAQTSAKHRKENTIKDQIEIWKLAAAKQPETDARQQRMQAEKLLRAK